MSDGQALAGDSGKAALRLHWRSRRLALVSEAQEALLNVALVAVPPLVGPGQRLGLYWPMAGEPDLRPLADRLGGRLALPAVLQGHSASERRLIYRAWEPQAPLASDACRVPAPARGIALEADELALLLVPALALDRRGLRLGTGGGWYDRLRQDPSWRNVPALIVAPSQCRLPSLPADPWDVPFDGWLDETGLHWLQRV